MRNRYLYQTCEKRFPIPQSDDQTGNSKGHNDTGIQGGKFKKPDWGSVKANSPDERYFIIVNGKIALERPTKYKQRTTISFFHADRFPNAAANTAKTTGITTMPFGRTFSIIPKRYEWKRDFNGTSL